MNEWITFRPITNVDHLSDRSNRGAAILRLRRKIRRKYSPIYKYTCICKHVGRVLVYDFRHSDVNVPWTFDPAGWGIRRRSGSPVSPHRRRSSSASTSQCSPPAIEGRPRCLNRSRRRKESKEKEKERKWRSGEEWEREYEEQVHEAENWRRK